MAESSGKGTQGLTVPAGALTSARLIPAARGPARGSGAAAAPSEVGGARSAGRGPCRRGSGAGSAALRLPPESARGGLSRPSRAPHMLLINIHHYIMGLAGSAQAGGEEPGRRRRHAGGGRIPGPPATGSGAGRADS